MKLAAKAKYFDGKTSRPHPVDLEILLHNKVSFYFENRKLVWPFEELRFEKTGGELSLVRRDNLSVSLKIVDPAVANSLYKSAKSSKNLSLYQNALDLGAKFYLFAITLTVAVIACFYIFVIPWASERVTEITPISFDEELGNTGYQQIKSYSDINEKKSAELQNFASQMDFETDRKLTFKVITDPEINAFALPNGTVVVYTGLLSKIANYEQLAALLGHEVTHIKQRHSTKTMARTLAGYLIVSLVIGDVNGLMSSLADNANQLNNLSFSRTFETESDLGAYEILKRNKINPVGMYQLFRTLKGNDNVATPKILSTHPLTEERINFSKELISRKEYSYLRSSSLENYFDILNSN